ncbi:MAG: PAS domain S-box protein [Polyangiaceae bacterium]|nr:PAS domain S-box protein [Polyangiaceae bacterium]
MGFLRDVYGLNPAIKLLVDPETGRIVDANDAAAAFYGYSVDELRTLHVQQFNMLAPAEVEAEMRRARDGNRSFFRFKHRLRNGDVRHVEVYSGPVEIEGRSRLLSIIHDVTPRERAIEDLARSEAQQRALLRALPVGVGLHRGSKFLWGNEGLLQLVGRTASDLVGSHVADIFAPDIADQVLARMERTAMLGSSSPLTRNELVHADGHRIAVDWMELPFDVDGDPCRMLLVVDVSERARLEEDLNRAQRMDAIGRMAGGVAHDFNNLLLVILGAADALARRPGSLTVFERNLERIREATQRASELTRQLLLVSRGNEARSERIDIGEAVRNLVELVRTTMPDKVDVRVEVPSGFTVLMPRSSVDQILLNLVVNARDAMPDGGTLSVTANEIDLAFQPLQPSGLAPGVYICIQVADDGVGMPPDVVTKAFEPFFTTKEPGKGTGLGLSTAYGIVRRAGGAIEIDSVVGRGTLVSVYLPKAALDTTVRTPPPPSREIQTVGRMRTVLLVDDQRSIRELIEQSLTERGYRVLSAAGAAEALLMAEQHGSTIDLLLSDVMMPKMRGPELTARVRVLLPDLPVLYMSGFTGDALVDAGVDAADLIEKPFAPDELVRRVAETLGRSTAGRKPAERITS